MIRPLVKIGFISIVFVLSSLPISTFADLNLPAIFEDNMVLQRNHPIPIWGKTKPGDKVSVSLAGKTANTIADKRGNWHIELPAMDTSGSHVLSASTKNEKIKIKDIVFGDVWLCSGQSNMEWTVSQANEAKREIASANFPNVRMFTVEKDISYREKEDIKPGNWKSAIKGNIKDFSAVCYFFGRKVHKETNTPIGLIHSSWGGTKIQSWTSWREMKNLEEYKDLNLEQAEKAQAENDKRIKKYEKALRKEKGLIEKWYKPKASKLQWQTINIPSYFKNTEIGDVDGVVWFKTHFELTEKDAEKKALLSLGPIDDQDHTYLNGKLLGSTQDWTADRIYDVPSKLLKVGENQLVVRVQDNAGGGGIYGKPEQLYLHIGKRKISLTQNWQYKKSILTSDFGIQKTGPNAAPSLLFNAMIKGLTKTKIAGAIWYQGESNALEAFKYRSLFKTMITDWRGQWGYEFPFYWVQLANFLKAPEFPGDSAWAELREAQDMALSLPKTGQAIAIDLGEADDIHPKNKQDVGKRLARVALNQYYKRNTPFSGPRYKEMQIKGSKIILSFDYTADGLQASNNTLKGFAIAGENRNFVWASAKIEGNKVIVWNKNIKKPIAVRYAWADNPEHANLYNSEGLPTAPFRTDSWPGFTEKNN